MPPIRHRRSSAAPRWSSSSNFRKPTGDGADKSYADPAYPHPQSALSLFDFDELHRIGFDHMRVPLDVGPLLQGDAQEQKDILEQLVAVVSAINRHGLAVLVTAVSAIAASRIAARPLSTGSTVRNSAPIPPRSSASPRRSAASIAAWWRSSR